MLNPTAAAQRQGVLQPIPTPPPPAEALKFPGRKPQNVPAFALTYILLRRSCKRMGAFIIHPCHLRECDPSYRVLTLALVDLPPTEYASLKLDTHSKTPFSGNRVNALYLI